MGQIHTVGPNKALVVSGKSHFLIKRIDWLEITSGTGCMGTVGAVACPLFFHLLRQKEDRLLPFLNMPLISYYHFHLRTVFENREKINISRSRNFVLFW